MNKEQQLRQNFNQIIQEFKTHLDFCLSSIHADHTYPAWIDNASDTQQNARLQACDIIGQIEYHDHQEPREVVFCPGLLGCSTQTLEIAKTLNAAKDKLKTCLQAMDKVKILADDHDTGRLVQRPLSKIALEDIGLARLHRWQAWRHLLVFDQCPSRIGFTWAHTRKVKKITLEQALAKLEKINSDDPYIQEQMSRLSRLSKTEPLAEVIPATTHLRANIVWDKEGVVTRKQVRTSLPILFPCKAGGPLPRFSPIRERHEKDQHRLQRMDIKLEEEAFLPSIHVYRYLPQYRTIDTNDVNKTLN